MLALLFILLFLQAIADTVITWVALRFEGIHEQNPVFNALREKIGFWPAALLIKGIVLSVVAMFGMYMWLLILMNFAYGYVLYNNVTVLNRATKINN